MSLAVSVDPPRLALGPGDDATVDVAVTNASEVVEHYAVRLLGLPPGQHVEVSPPVSKLHPGESGRISVRLGLSPQHPPQAAHLVLGVLVTSPYREEVSRCEEVRLEVRPMPGLSVRADPEVVHGARGEYTVTVANEGNTALEVALAGSDPERHVRLRFSPQRVRLEPGATGLSTVTAAANRPLTGQERRRTISVTARAGDRTGDLTLTLVQRPRIASAPMRVAAALGALAVTAATVLGGALLVRNAISDKPGDTQNASASTPRQQSAQQPAQQQAQQPAQQLPQQPVPAQPVPAGQPSAAASVPAGQPAGQAPGIDGGQPITVDFSAPPAGVAARSQVINANAYPGVSLSAVPDASSERCSQETRVQFVPQGFVAPGSSTPLANGKIRYLCMDMPIRIQFDRPVTQARIRLVALTDEGITATSLTYGVAPEGGALRTAAAAPEQTLELVWSGAATKALWVGAAPGGGGPGAYRGVMTALRSVSAS